MLLTSTRLETLHIAKLIYDAIHVSEDYSRQNFESESRLPVMRDTKGEREREREHQR